MACGIGGPPRAPKVGVGSRLAAATVIVGTTAGSRIALKSQRFINAYAGPQNEGRIPATIIDRRMQQKLVIGVATEKPCLPAGLQNHIGSIDMMRCPAIT